MIKEEEFSERLPGPSKRCNCKHSKCIKLYCECYQANVFCDSNCHCHNCYNNPQNERYRKKAIQSTLEKNPSAFQPKIITSDSKPDPLNLGKHNKGCACRKSGCMKKYCECFQAKVPCSDICKCCECRNQGFLTRDHFLRSTRSENEYPFYSLLLAKNNDHLDSILAYQEKKGILDVKDIETMSHKMKKVMGVQEQKLDRDEVDYICGDENNSGDELDNQKIKQILDIFINLLKSVEEK